jgi:hypothetical protein
MVGAFGEVQVMDWGLAKALGAAGVAPAAVAEASTLYTTRGPGSPEQTAPGTVLGTPAYMSPEQARGQVDHLDARADVFALGATLCVVLTGRPPYAGSDARPVRERAAEGDTAEALARLDGCGADAELIRLARACLAFRPSDRPRDAAAVAAAVAAYRAGVEQRLRQAEVARAAAEVKAREERKRRRVLLGLAAAVLLLVLTGGGAACLWQQQRAAAAARRRQADGETALVLDRGRALLASGLQTRDLDRLAEAKAEAEDGGAAGRGAGRHRGRAGRHRAAAAGGEEGGQGMSDKKLPGLKELVGKALSAAEQEMMLTLPGFLMTAFAGKVYERDTDPRTGKPFASLYRWLWVMPPPGIGLCNHPYLGAEEIIHIMRRIHDGRPADDRADIAALIDDLVKGHGEKKRPGRKKKESENCGSTPAINGTVRHASKSPSSLAARMAESADPRIRAAWQGHLAGEYRSVTAAALACGMIEDANAPLARLKQNWRKASAAERRAFRDFIGEGPDETP